MSVANDNAASVSFEGLVGNLLHAGTIDLARLDGFQYVPYEGLAVEVARIQGVKAAFFEQFWETSGKIAVRTLAAAAAEVGLVSATFRFFFCLFLIGFVYLVQGATPDRPSEDNRLSEDRRSPSGNDAAGSSGAQV